MAFGYVPPQAVPPPNYYDPRSFVGYPEDVAQALHIRVSNASCPGETTASFLVPGALSNGCENSPGSSIGYRTQYPLHVQYQGTQMQYALKYLAVHRHTQLVTIDIGANDVFLCQETTADRCASTAEFQAVLREIGANLTIIYTLIRDVAQYHGLLVALTYYSLSYSDPTQVAGTEALDSVIASVTEKFGGKVADGFAAFEGPSAAFGGSPCAAGLLIKLPGGTCDVHPSPAGQLLLAQAIEDVVGALPPK
ncbi:MAG: SGNH/GDSL hydrolase family protein [Streptosporangiaceae bacterium]|nr:SGNH/GDSL hydrolase family protein [Streptosporangiaceae bacterium]